MCLVYHHHDQVVKIFFRTGSPPNTGLQVCCFLHIPKWHNRHFLTLSFIDRRKGPHANRKAGREGKVRHHHSTILYFYLFILKALRSPV